MYLMPLGLMETTYIFSLEQLQSIRHQGLCKIIKSITARELFKKFPEIKKALWGSEFWSDGGYIGTVGDGVLSDIIRNYVEKQGTTEEKEGFKQMSLLEFD